VTEPVTAAIWERRSIGRVAPDPLPRRLVAELVGAAIQAPNHHLTCPWRFVVLAGDARREIGEAHARAVARLKPGHPEAGLAKEAALLERAPVVIACCVAGSVDPAQAREDRDTVAAGVQNMLLAAHARGLAAIWRTGAMVSETEVAEALGLDPGDGIVGFVYVGHRLPDVDVRPPGRPSVDELATWRGW
jgi:nitroreductase